MQIDEDIQNNGTFDLSIQINGNDIDVLINALKRLKNHDFDHFHIRNNFNGNSNKLCDVEISYDPTATNDFEAEASSKIHYPEDDSIKTHE